MTTNPSLRNLIESDILVNMYIENLYSPIMYPNLTKSKMSGRHKQQK
jgi:hypothetical protein